MINQHPQWTLMPPPQLVLRQCLSQWNSWMQSFKVTSWVLWLHKQTQHLSQHIKPVVQNHHQWAWTVMKAVGHSSPTNGRCIKHKQSFHKMHLLNYVTIAQRRQSGSVTQHSRARSQSLSNPSWQTRQIDQDIRTAFFKRKNPESSPDEKCSAHDKMHKSGLGIIWTGNHGDDWTSKRTSEID